MSRKAIDLTGQRFGRLVVLERAAYLPFYVNNHARWKCQCDCGAITFVASNSLIHGNSKSCGCSRRDKARKSAEKGQE